MFRNYKTRDVFKVLKVDFDNNCYIGELKTFCGEVFVFAWTPEELTENGFKRCA